MHQAALKMATEYIGKWEYKNCIQQVILYGSCARGDYNTSSDIDIYIEFYKEVPKKILREFRADIRALDNCNIEIDVHYGFKPLSENDGLFYRNIEKEGVVLWKRK